MQGLPQTPQIPRDRSRHGSTRLGMEPDKANDEIFWTSINAPSWVDLGTRSGKNLPRIMKIWFPRSIFRLSITLFLTVLCLHSTQKQSTSDPNVISPLRDTIGGLLHQFLLFLRGFCLFCGFLCNFRSVFIFANRWLHKLSSFQPYRQIYQPNSRNSSK